MSSSLNPRRGIVLSDTHFLGGVWKRCDSRYPREEISRLFEKADLVVLNGDTFDFDYSGMTIDAWLDNVENILKGWLTDNPQCEFQYVMGNHDRYRILYERLMGDGSKKMHKKKKFLAEEFPGRLHVHVEDYRLGNALFIHGDKADKPERIIKLRSFKHMRETDEFNKTAIHPEQMLLEGDHKTRIKKLAAVLDAEKLRGIEHVFAGHFHFPALNADLPGHPGVRYHNTASPRGEASFLPLFFDIEEENRISAVRPALPLALVPAGLAKSPAVSM